MRHAVVLFSILSITVGCGGGAETQAKDAAGGDTGAPAVASGPVKLDDAGPRGDPKKGEAIFASKCVACHQKDGTGMGGVLGADFVNNPVHLAKPDSVLLTSIAEGVKGAKAVMPPQKDLLSEQERKDALAYIRETFSTK